MGRRNHSKEIEKRVRVCEKLHTGQKVKAIWEACQQNTKTCGIWG
jgi:hypothetical protein